MRPALSDPVEVTLQQKLEMLETATALPEAMQWRRALVLSKLDKFEEALALCEGLDKSLRSAGQALLHAQLLNADTASCDPRRAEEMLRGLLDQSLDRDTRVTALLALSHIREELGFADEARTLAQEALAFAPNHPAALRRHVVL